jgi:hypothetical protein
MKPTSQEIIYNLLYHAFLAIRVGAYTNDYTYIFDTADLFHNVPLQLDRVRAGTSTHDEVLAWIRNRADEKKLRPWIEMLIATTRSDTPPLQHE